LSDRVLGEGQVMMAGVLGFLRALRDGEPHRAPSAMRRTTTAADRDTVPS